MKNYKNLKENTSDEQIEADLKKKLLKKLKKKHQMFSLTAPLGDNDDVDNILVKFIENV